MLLIALHVAHENFLISSIVFFIVNSKISQGLLGTSISHAYTLKRCYALQVSAISIVSTAAATVALKMKPKMRKTSTTIGYQAV